jgi:hypothetical protein
MKELPNDRDPTVEELDVIITRLALMKTRLDKARSLAKIQAHMEKERRKTAVRQCADVVESLPLVKMLQRFC